MDAGYDPTDRLGAMKVVTSLVDIVDDTILHEALEFGIAVLEGGNRAVQDNLLQYFEAYDERFFVSVRDIIVSATTAAMSDAPFSAASCFAP